MNLQKLLKSQNNSESSKPVFFDLRKKTHEAELLKLFRTKKIIDISNDIENQLREYYEISNPQEIYKPNFEANFQKYLTHSKKNDLNKLGKWVYFPWIGSLVHILNEPEFYIVRTGRNRNLITTQEQEKFYKAHIGIAGLSVGNSVALAIVLQGGAKNIKLADFDILALSNTNRIRTGIPALGKKKTEITARQIYELNPYAQIELFSEGLNEKNIKKFFSGLNVVIDEIDNLAIKYLIREEAKKLGLPVIMAADNADGGVIDIERYDQNPNPKFFHGRMGNVTYKELKGLNKFAIGKMITKLVGTENVTERMQDSLMSMGKTVVSWPQLGGAALLNGSAVAYCIRKIVCGQPLQNNRSIISLDEKLLPNYFSKAEKNKRTKAAKAFKKIFGL